MTRSPKIVTIFGATGTQGGSVAQSLLQNKDFQVRAISRDPESPRAQELERLGATIVKANGWNKDEITDAFKGSWGAFVNTNSDDPMFLDKQGPTEFDLGKTIVDALIAADVKNLVYSSFVSTREYTGGAIPMKSMDEKSRIEKYAVASGHFSTVGSIHAGWYMENYLNEEVAQVMGGFPFYADAEGYKTLYMPLWGKTRGTGIPWICIDDDFGDLVHGMFLDPKKYHQRPVPAISEILSWDEFARAFEKVTGEKARYVPIPAGETLAPGVSELDDHRELFRFGQATDGKYFGDLPGTTDIAATLKGAATLARGKSESEAQLTTAEKWFRSNYKAKA
ncbi:NmrA/HSCARG family protein [Aspergillus candidus]|uniref:NmrA-like family protein n=1 Tax=Aspergillus candidus TaxID=41067 RepID=A0A2I2F8H8_ASPCN|nr:NmrA-like family protein [Aspergillus candidus]PLB36930.1 NmrA-like family protein [Aspergillus candidus]